MILKDQRLIVVLMIGLFNLLVSCVGVPPKEEYSLAHTALESARTANAGRFAPGFFNQAEDFYKQAVVQYEDRRYLEAKENFRRAREFAEKAENYTVTKKAQTGEVE